MPATNAISNRFYPQLSDVVTVDDLPDFLDFAKDGLNSFLSGIHYKNLQYSKSQRGDSASYKIDIISKNLGLDLPFGLRLVLNPDVNGDSSISSFPVTLQYQWQIISFLRSFNLPNVSLDPDGLFALGLQIFKVTDQEVIAHILNFFVNPPDTSTTKYQQIVDDINILFPTANLTIPDGQTPTVDLIAKLITQNTNIPKSISEVMFAVYLLSSDLATTKTKLQQFFNLIVPGGIENYIQKLIKPSVKASLKLSAGIEFPTNILQPVDAHGVIIPNEKSVFQFAEATFTVDTDSGIGSQLELGGSLTPQYAQIGNTGLIMSFTDAKVDLSNTTNIPEADAAGYPVDFMGLYIKQASISFNKFGQDDTTKVSASLTATNMLIGTGGISGTIKLEDNGLLYRKFGNSDKPEDNFSVELDTFEITFKMGAIVSSSISGKLKLPGNFQSGGAPAEIDIDASIKDNGDFSITAKAIGNVPPITFPDVFELYIRSLTIGEKGGKFFVGMAGTLDFIADVPGLGEVLPKGIQITKLLIWQDGSIEFDGGGLVVPKSFKLSVGPVKLEVSNISIGAHTREYKGVERNYYYFGFDGMINTGNAGVKATGNGIKFYFTHDRPDLESDRYISIAGIAIDLTIPGSAPKDQAAFILNGFLSMKNPETSNSNAATEYTGSVQFSMPKLHFAGSAAMRLTPSIPAFVVDIGLELPTAVPLGATDLGIYAFRGLIGKHYVPDKAATTPPLPEDASWWEYYKAKSVLTGAEGIEIDKFSSKSGFTIGAGVSIATESDSGYVFSSKLFLMLGVSNMFVIQGQAAILKKRIGLNDHIDPPFSALIVFGDDTIQGDVGVNFKLPEGGEILSLQAHVAMAFYFNNASGWYIDIGKDTPDTEQVKAKILSIFQGYAYLMISSQGVKAGAGISYNFSINAGVAKLALKAYLYMGGFISFKPVQIGGFIQMGAQVTFKVFGIGGTTAIELALAVEAPKPFVMTGSFKLRLPAPWPVKHFNVGLSVSWRFNNDQSALRQPNPVLGLPNPATGYTPAIASNISSGDTFAINYVTVETTGASGVIPPPGDPLWQYNFNDENDVKNVTVPLDSFIDIELLKPVKPGTAPIGGAGNQLPVGYMEMVPPQKGVSKQVKHQYELVDLGIYAWDATSSTWTPYNVYEAVTAIVNSNTGSGAIDLSQLKPGYWQFVDKDKYNKIRLLSQNMFSYMNGTSNSQLDLDGRNFNGKDVFCYDTIQKENVIDWKDVAAGTVYPQASFVAMKTLGFVFSGVTGSVKSETSFNNTSLQIEGGQGTVLISFPEPIAHLELDFGDNLNAFTVNLLKINHRPGLFGEPISLYNTVSTSTVAPAQQNAVIVYNNEQGPVDHISLVFNNPVAPDYDGYLILGGHSGLPDQYLNPAIAGLEGDTEMDKTLIFPTWYNQSFTAADVLAMDYTGQAGIAVQWPMDSIIDDTAGIFGITTGGPDNVPGFYKPTTGQPLTLHNVYSFTSNEDSFVVPRRSALKVENGSFAFETTAIFDPFTSGISTLITKVARDSNTGYQKGYTLHLVQATPGTPQTAYTTAGSVPTFNVVLTCYSGLSSSSIQASGKYTIDCAGNLLSAKQYKRIFVSVDRQSGKLDIYIDKILVSSTDIPAELAVHTVNDTYTYLNQLSYITDALQSRADDNGTSAANVIDESQILSDTLNKTIQPVWRPNTTFAIKIHTQDRVEDQNPVPDVNQQVHIFGFQTAGPLGHFHQQSKVYQDLADKDQATAFKQANLLYYIDYERSFPDAQSRYDLSKPVFCTDPQVKLFFNQPYISAMYADWNTYHNMPELKSSLQLQLLDPSGATLTQELSWEAAQEIPINDSNYKSLPRDQQILYLLNRIASQGGCNPMPSPVIKRLRQGTYKFPDLLPNKLYTAVFSALYGVGNADPDSLEVHKFGFITSRFATFEDQAKSYILNDTPGFEQYAIYTRNVSFSSDDIEQTLKKLINSDQSDDPSSVLQYAIPYERLVYGGLKITDLEPFEYSTVTLVINTDPADSTNKKLLGILVRNPEPFNDPKLPAADLVDTIKPSIILPDNSVLDASQFLTIYSGDTSAAFITNAAMDVPLGSLKLYFRYKIFNGIDYETEFAEYEGPAIDITPNF